MQKSLNALDFNLSPKSSFELESQVQCTPIQGTDLITLTDDNGSCRVYNFKTNTIEAKPIPKVTNRWAALSKRQQILATIMNHKLVNKPAMNRSKSNVANRKTNKPQLAQKKRKTKAADDEYIKFNKPIIAGVTRRLDLLAFRPFVGFFEFWNTKTQEPSLSGSCNFGVSEVLMYEKLSLLVIKFESSRILYFGLKNMKFRGQMFHLEGMRHYRLLKCAEDNYFILVSDLMCQMLLWNVRANNALARINCDFSKQHLYSKNFKALYLEQKGMVLSILVNTLSLYAIRKRKLAKRADLTIEPSFVRDLSASIENCVLLGDEQSIMVIDYMQMEVVKIIRVVDIKPEIIELVSLTNLGNLNFVAQVRQNVVLKKSKGKVVEKPVLQVWKAEFV